MKLRDRIAFATALRLVVTLTLSPVQGWTQSVSIEEVEPELFGTVRVEAVVPRSPDHEPSTRLNMDIRFSNQDPTTPIHLNRVQILYSGGEPAPLDLQGDEALLETVFGGEVKPFLDEGASWGTTGLVVADGADATLAVLEAVEAVSGGSNFVAGRTFDGNRYLASMSRSGSLSMERVSGAGTTGAVRATAGDGLVTASVTSVPSTRVLLERHAQADLSPLVDAGGKAWRIDIDFPGCVEEAVRGLDVRTLAGVESYTVVAALDCNGHARIGLARVDETGALDANLGVAGKLVLDFAGSAVLPVGVAERIVAGVPRTYVGAAIGDGCEASSGECFFGVTRLYSDGAVDAAYGDFGGWALASFDGATEQVPHAMAVDASGRTALAGHAIAPARQIAVAVFDPAGIADPTFDGDGRLLHMVAGELSEARAVGFVTGGVAVGGWSYWESDTSGMIPGIAVVRFDFGVAPAFVWEHNVHRELGALGNSLVVDDLGRILVAGSESDAFAATARLLPNGAPDSKTWLLPGVRRKLFVPEDRELPFPPPAEVIVELYFDGSSVPVTVARPLATYATTANDAGYAFPGAPGDIAHDELWKTGQWHWLGSNHRYSDTQRFAYDWGMVRWNGTEWTRYREGAKKPYGNRDYVVWGRPVRAMADGRVVECYRRRSDNSAPGVQDSGGGGGNSFWVRHSPTEYVLYAHLRAGSVPAKLCPVEGDQGKSGALVQKGTLLGQVGNSGSSTGPHLHIHLQDQKPGADGVQGYPLHLRGTLAADQDAVDQQQPDVWVEVDQQAIGRAMYMFPVE